VLGSHQVQADEELTSALQQVKTAGLIAEEQVRLCVIGNGAPWVWKQVRKLFTSTVDTSDYYIPAKAALPSGVGGSSGRIRVSAMFGSSAESSGGTCPTPSRCWPAAARYTMAPRTEPLMATGSEPKSTLYASLLKNREYTPPHLSRVQCTLSSIPRSLAYEAASRRL